MFEEFDEFDEFDEFGIWVLEFGIWNLGFGIWFLDFTKRANSHFPSAAEQIQSAD